ncbi:MAG: GNAT family N-acetyltransferase [Chloroflexota bacterium]
MQNRPVCGGPLEIRLASPEWADALGEFFAALDNTGDYATFHPHPLSREAAAAICIYRGADLYYLLTAGKCVLGYGLLRGWDEGYEVPSLGVAINPSLRGRGLGGMLMSFLHQAAAINGATKVRLKVHGSNEAAVLLYRENGYEFVGEEGGQLIGYRDLRVG